MKKLITTLVLLVLACALSFAQRTPQVHIVGWEAKTSWGEDTEAIYWLNGNRTVLPKTSDSAMANAIAVSGSNVHIVGRDGHEAIHWLNGYRIVLPKTSDSAAAYAIAVSGSNVYIAGYDGSNAVYWLNGNRIVLPKKSNFAVANAIAVSGSNIYVAGYEDDPNGYKAYTAVYWLNGNKEYLPHVGQQSKANAITVSGSDVYISGEDGTGTEIDPIYWLNGKRIVLQKEEQAFAHSITVSGSNVYVAGSDVEPLMLSDYVFEIGIGGDAVYWQNRNRIVLPKVGITASASAIALYGADIYVIGTDGYEVGDGNFLKADAVYWLNGKRIVLPKAGEKAIANGIAVTRTGTQTVLNTN